ncbi:MAG: Wzz/FepE/Etk N-terminal domain-containing protein [Kofleriaceae bacterium]
MIETDLLAFLGRRWRIFALCIGLGGAIGVAYALLAPEWYEATLTVIQSQRSHETAAMSLAAKLPGALDSLSTDVERIAAVLSSQSVTDEVIVKFGLDERYGTAHREQTRSALWAHCAIHADHKSGVVALTCEDREPQVAQEIAAFFGDVGNRVFGRVSGSSAREEEHFLEGQVVKARKDVEDASRKLRDFQEQHKIIDLPEQSKAVISAMASLKGDVLSKQLELQYLSGFSSPTEASVVQLRQQITILETKLDQMESTEKQGVAPRADGSGAFFPAAMNVPKLSSELEQLLRDQKVQETVFAMLTQRYELARVESARDTSTFQILDAPTLPTYRARPKRRQVVLLGAALGFVFALGWLAVPRWWRRRTGGA